MCPIGHDALREPVVAPDGHTYDRKNLNAAKESAIRRGDPFRSPMTREVWCRDPRQPVQLIPNRAIVAAMEAWVVDLLPDSASPLGERLQALLESLEAAIDERSDAVAVPEAAAA